MKEVKNKYTDTYISLKEIYTERIELNRKCPPEDGDVLLDFETSIEELGDNDIKVRLNSFIRTSKDEITVNVSVTAVFNCVFPDDADEDTIKELKEKNTIAILFPFVRSQVTLATSQLDCPPFTMPAININAFFEDKKKKGKKTDKK